MELSKRIMKPIAFVAAWRCALDDMQNGVFCERVPRDARDLARDSDAYFAYYQGRGRYTWQGFFDDHLVGWFHDLGARDLRWRDETNLAGRQIVQAKRAEFEPVQSGDCVAQTAKRAAYLAIAAFAHGDEPLET